MEDKKNAYRFTLQFNKNDPRHERAVDILNQQGRGVSQFIVSAVLHYLDCNLQPLDPLLQAQMLEKIVKDTVEKAVSAYTAVKTDCKVENAVQDPLHEIQPQTSSLPESDLMLLNDALSSFG